jgi:hypothetical protein
LPASVARDVFSTLASCAGVERLSNCAVISASIDEPETVMELVLHRFASKFELEQVDIDLTKEYISTGDAADL